jgi:hypothetical protein
LTLLREMRGEMGEARPELSNVREHVVTTSDTANVRNEVAATERRLGERIAHLNCAVMEYHSSAIGHGVLFSEFEERLRRVE